MRPLVSIILPSYNGAQFIARAISSVLKQSYAVWELIIISDGSNDETKKIVSSFDDKRIKFIENSANLGIQKTLNKGISLSNGSYIARIDDDDIWIDLCKLETQVLFLEKHSDYNLLGTDAVVINTEGEKLSINIMPKTDSEIRKKILSKNCFLHSTIMIRKVVIEKTGSYSENKETLHAEDFDLWLRMGLNGKFANLDKVTTHLTARDGSLTSKNRVLQARNILKAMMKYRKKYPNFITGYIMGALRIIFFSALSWLPFKVTYLIQRIYRSI